MKRVSIFGLVVLLAVLSAALAACSPSPKSRADDFLTYLPEEVGAWERNDTVKLLGSTVTSKGHAILTYEGPDDAMAYVVVEVFPTEDAAEVSAADRERQWLLQGLEIEKDRAPGQSTANVAQQGLNRYALFQEGDIVIEVNTIAADAETAVDDATFGELLTMVRAALEKLVE